MIVSASRRTDIPALYPEWLARRLREGWCRSVNPFNPKQVRRVPLRADETTALVLWTRNAAPLEPYLSELDRSGIPYYFLWTLTGYGPPLEPGLLPTEELVATFHRLARRLGPERLVWRYDPILVSSVTPLEAHRDRFTRLAEQLAGATTTVKLSLADFYAKVDRRLRPLEARGLSIQRNPEEQPELEETIREMVRVARANGMVPESCAESIDLAPMGVVPGACIDPVRLERLLGRPIPDGRDPGQRRGCRCIPSRDIGAYDTCTHGCHYCYAVGSVQRARERHRRHDPGAPALVA